MLKFLTDVNFIVAKNTLLTYSSHPFILKFDTGKFFGVRNPKITLRRLKINQS